MMSDSRHQEKTFTFENKTWESRKIFKSQKKKKNEFEIKIVENISNSRKKIQNREKYFKLEKNVSESRNILLQESRKKIELTSNSINTMQNNVVYYISKSSLR